MGTWDKFKRAVLSSPQREERNNREEKNQKLIQETHQALLDAASSTMDMAQEVTNSLKDRIDDYSSQISAISYVLSDALVMCNSKGVIEAFNPAAERIFGWRSRHMVGQNIEMLFRLHDRSEVSYSTVLEAFLAPTVTDFQAKRRDTAASIRGVTRNGNLFHTDVRVSDFIRSDNNRFFLLLVSDITEVIESEQRYIHLFEQQLAIIKALPDAVITIDGSNSIVTANVPNDFGCSHLTPRVVGYDIGAVYPEATAGTFAHNVNVARSESGNVAWDYAITNHGITCHYEARATRCGENVLVVVRDVTDITVTREELLESEEHFKAFGSASSEAMMIHSGGKVMDWNPRLSELTGYAPVEISQMDPLDFFHPLERDKASNILTDEHARSYETLFLTKDGHTVEVAINSKQVDWKNMDARIKVIRDVTAFKDLNQILEINRERYRTLTDNTIDVVCCYNRDFKLNFANKTFWDYFLVDDEIASNHLLSEFIHGDDHDKVRAHLAKLTPEQNIRRTLHRVLRGTEVRWLDWIDRAVFDNDGNLLEYQGTGRDATDYVNRNKVHKLPPA